MATFNLETAQKLVAMFGGDSETLIDVQHCQAGHSGRGLYAGIEGHPEEGLEYLGNPDQESWPTQVSVSRVELGIELGLSNDQIRENYPSLTVEQIERIRQRKNQENSRNDRPIGGR